MRFPKKKTRFFSLLTLLFFTFIILVFVKFSKNQNSSDVSSSPSPPILSIPEPEDLLRKCGDITRDDFEVNYDHFTQITGPEWSPDCKNAAIGVWQSGTGYVGSDPEALKEFEEFRNQQKKLRQEIAGLHLYNPNIRQSKRIYVSKDSENLTFLRWENNDTLIFKINQQHFKLNIKNQEISETD